VAKTPEDGDRFPAPSDWQGWQRWVEGVDWSDWRSWLRRVASTDWAPGQTAGPPWPEAAPVGAVSLTVRAYQEDEPGDRIREQLAATWPAFHRWWRNGANTRPAAGEARARLEEHMPELVPTWERLTAMIPGEPDAGAALALWNPPPFLTGCSQAAVLDGGPALVRNYDWDYRIFDGVVARTAYTGRRVLGMLDCLWGLLDGVNDSGLAISLTFGGRHEVGEGFGIPLVIRYVLEVCGTVDEAVRVLRRVPVHMSYNVTAIDRNGRWNGRRTQRRSAAWSGKNGSRSCWRTAPTRLASSRPACALRSTPPASTRASGRFTPLSTGPSTASRATTGHTAPGSTRWTKSNPRASICGSASPDPAPASRHPVVALSGAPVQRRNLVGGGIDENHRAA
jgi:hypothetical protein